MISQSRGKLTAIVNYRTLLRKSSKVKKFSFFLKISYILIIMEQKRYTWNLFAI